MAQKGGAYFVTMSVAEMARLYRDDKLSLADIAERANVSKPTVWRRLKAHNVELRPSPSAQPLSARKAVDAYESNGRSITKAAKELGVAYRDVRRALIRSGTYEPSRLGGIEHLDAFHKSGDSDFRCAVIDLVRSGLSKSEVAVRMDTTRETVDYIIYLVEQNHVPEAECQSNKQAKEQDESEMSELSTHDDSSPESEAQTISKSSGDSIGSDSTTSQQRSAQN